MYERLEPLKDFYLELSTKSTVENLKNAVTFEVFVEIQLTKAQKIVKIFRCC